MSKYIDNNGYNVKISTLTQSAVQSTIKELTVMPQQIDMKDNKDLEFKLYRYDKTKEYLIVPRYYGIAHFGQPDVIKFDAEEIDIGFKQKLRDKQQIVAEKCIKYILKHGGGLLSVPCGFGKTVCALWIAQKLGLKTLIVVHKSFLLYQWIERAKEFLGIGDNQIGTIRQNVCDVDGKDIVIGMIHTIAKREYNNIFNTFGLVIYDEAHHVACKFFSRSLLKTSAQYTLALTATPYRNDGLIKVMYWFLGGTIYREKAKPNKNVIAKIFNYNSTDKLFKTKQKWFNGRMSFDTGKMTTNICNVQSRNNKIIEIINHIRRTNPDRKILILSGRKNHLEILKNGVDIEIQSDQLMGRLDENETYSCYYTGDCNAMQRQEAETRGDIIFATYAMADEGLDIKHLNTIILASPKKDVVQSIGRIMRTILQAGDVRPMIIDIADELMAIKNWTKKRYNMYVECSYDIEEYHIMNDDILTDNLIYNNKWISDTILRYNDSIKIFKNQMREYRRLGGLDSGNYRCEELKNNIYIDKILHVDKLTEKDFDTILLKDAEYDTMDIMQDIELDMNQDMNPQDMNQDMNPGCMVDKPYQLNTLKKKRLFYI